MRHLLAVLFSLIFVLLLFASTSALSLRSFAFDANFYMALLKSRGILPALERDPLRYFDLGGQLDQLNALPAGVQRDALAVILPPGWLERQITVALQNWLDSQAADRPAPPVELDLRQIKDRLQGPPGQQVVDRILNSIPACKPGQTIDLSLVQLPNCIPGVFDRSTISAQALKILRDVAGRLPGTAQSGVTLPTLPDEIRYWVSLFASGTITLGLVVATILFWLIGAFMAGRDWKGRLYWLGGSLAFGSIVVLGFNVALYVFGPSVLPRSIDVAPIGALTPAFADIIRSTITIAMQQFAVRGTMAGGALFIVALMLMGFGMLLKPARTAPPQYRS